MALHRRILREKKERKTSIQQYFVFLFLTSPEILIMKDLALLPIAKPDGTGEATHGSK